MEVKAVKNPYDEGTNEHDLFAEGVAAERDRLIKVLSDYHNAFSGGDMMESEMKMEIRYLYEFLIGAKTVKD